MGHDIKSLEKIMGQDNIENKEIVGQHALGMRSRDQKVLSLKI